MGLTIARFAGRLVLTRSALVAEVSERENIAVIERFRLPGRSFLMPPTNVELGLIVD